MSPLGTSTSDLSFYSYGTSSSVFTLANTTGAATFSSSVTAGTYLGVSHDGSDTIGSGAYLVLSASTSSRQWIQQLSASQNLTYYHYTGSAWIQPLTITSGGGINMPIVYSTYSSGNAANVYMGAGGTLYVGISSIKYKKDIRNYDKGLAEVLKMRPVYYKGISDYDGDTQFAGLIAEEIEELGLKEFVVYEEDGSPRSLAYASMVTILTKAIQEQQAQIEELKNKLNNVI